MNFFQVNGKLLGFIAVLDFDFVVQCIFWILAENLSGLNEALSVRWQAHVIPAFGRCRQDPKFRSSLTS